MGSSSEREARAPLSLAAHVDILTRHRCRNGDAPAETAGHYEGTKELILLLLFCRCCLSLLYSPPSLSLDILTIHVRVYIAASIAWQLARYHFQFKVQAKARRIAERIMARLDRHHQPPHHNDPLRARVGAPPATPATTNTTTTATGNVPV